MFPYVDLEFGQEFTDEDGVEWLVVTDLRRLGLVMAIRVTEAKSADAALLYVVKHPDKALQWAKEMGNVVSKLSTESSE